VDGLALLATARAAGLKVWTRGSRLLVRGPSRLEPLALQLLKAKTEIVTTLLDEQVFANGRVKPCFACKGRNFWSHVGGGSYVCSRCHPVPRPECAAEELVLAETITRSRALRPERGESSLNASGRTPARCGYERTKKGQDGASRQGRQAAALTGVATNYEKRYFREHPTSGDGDRGGFLG
jgi:hypothetical protein